MKKNQNCSKTLSIRASQTYLLKKIKAVQSGNTADTDAAWTHYVVPALYCMHSNKTVTKISILSSSYRYFSLLSILSILRLICPPPNLGTCKKCIVAIGNFHLVEFVFNNNNIFYLYCAFLDTQDRLTKTQSINK